VSKKKRNESVEKLTDFGGSIILTESKSFHKRQLSDCSEMCPLKDRNVSKLNLSKNEWVETNGYKN
jgi:hypothetical protein